MDRYAAEPITGGTNTLGEGPLWIGAIGSLAWTDIHGNAIYLHSLADGGVRKVPLSSFIACMGETDDGRIIAAGGTGWVIYDTDFKYPEPYAPAPFDVSSLRFNDGKVGPDGAFWAGSMDWIFREGAASLYRLSSSSMSRPSVREKDGPFTIPNGLGWSPDSSVMYLTESTTQTIFRYCFNPADGSIANREIFVRDTDLPGVPDGLAVDASGCVWSARWGAGLVVAYTPEGRKFAEVETPASQPSCCCFGGRNLDELFITSARLGLENPGPADGALYRCRCGSAGLPNAKYTINEEQETNS